MAADFNGRTNLSDAVYVLSYLFLVSTVLRCEDAADTNDTDAVYLLNYLFLGGPPPADPFPTCGPDPTTDDDLTCESFPPCD